MQRELVERGENLYVKNRTYMMEGVWNSIIKSLIAYRDFTNHEWYANFARANNPKIFDGLQYMPQNSLVEALKALKLANKYSGTWYALEQLCVACFGSEAIISRTFNNAEKWKFSVNISNISARFIYSLASKAEADAYFALASDGRTIATIDTIAVFSFDLKNFFQRYVSPDEELEQIIFT